MKTKGYMNPMRSVMIFWMLILLKIKPWKLKKVKSPVISKKQNDLAKLGPVKFGTAPYHTTKDVKNPQFEPVRLNQPPLMMKE
ncbi:hypothetical protein JTE90_010935 [Oedothorax gibbosus]|uniref:Uncharacterized protein n=1 Tax=Oedothorax gibbosus TaxID=931172 RepID=A0AAV6TM05_9ARAC|nr:hypothetical protein JTE90_010935 [Oedothorax gibbosus]